MIRETVEVYPQQLMKELQEIIAAFEQVKQCGEMAAIATLVNVKGSTYRRPGARMLITQSGRQVGTISGGCLESDVFERAQQVMSSGEPMVVTYDSTSVEDAIWGLGLGCNGVVQVLIQRLVKTQPSHLEFITECLRHQQPGVLATVFSVNGQVRAKVGAHLMLYPDKTVAGDIEETTLTQAIITDAQAALRDRCSSIKVYQLSAGSADVFIEVIQLPTSLIIFGAGHDAIPVVRFAKALGWLVTVVDSRSISATPERFLMADKVVLTRPELAQKHIVIDPRTVAVVMTHTYLHDLELLKLLLPSPVRYLGVLGPKSRTQRLLQELFTESVALTEEQLQRLYGPVGLDIGADTPEAIALSIVAEIQAVLANRSAGFLRDRQGAIYSRIDQTLVPH